jgi:hypothetical protein
MSRLSVSNLPCASSTTGPRFICGLRVLFLRADKIKWKPFDLWVRNLLPGPS